MSILTKPYTISVWEDVYVNGQLKEQRLGIIGSNIMQAQCRALEPNLVRNVNGTKKFSFKMYAKYIDATTGEKVDNPFIGWLVAERKVKLQYKNKWYDFIIKDIDENSSTYLYTYHLEDALVQELSKNGFNVVLDEKENNNMNNAEGLADEVLKETDWTVSSEKFVETIDEALVYLTVTKEDGVSATKLENNYEEGGKNFLNSGLKEVPNQTISKDATVLAFYSSCKNKPHRFQFIYLPNDYSKNSINLKNGRTIDEDNCQYYIEFEPGEYGTPDDTYGFCLPNGFGLLDKVYSDSAISPSDSTISTWFRAGRYGFAQQAKYIPLLDRYCQVFNKTEQGQDILYYGFSENRYDSPIFTTNLVTNTEFKNTSGWTGTYLNGDAEKCATIENVFGQFNGKNFVSSMDQLLKNNNATDESLDSFLAGCTGYMKIVLKGSENSLVINSGPFDNRALIGEMPVGSKWAFRAECYGSDGNNATLTFTLGDYEYSTSNGGYAQSTNISFDNSTSEGYTIYTVTQTISDFKKDCKLKIGITGEPGVYYIKNLEFFRASFKKDKNGNDQVIPLLGQGEDIEGVVNTEYKYFKASELENAIEAKDIEFSCVTDTLSYETYKPVYNSSGEKIRSVSAKESNYFNILQSIAETFECWIELEVTRDESTGAINEKTVKLKNYTGGINYAAIRYGVNLKEIQRTSTSKNITTKLIVKQNNNKHGKNGFCTIARAGSNPTNDSVIYDFSYYQNMGLLNANEYINTVYKSEGYFPELARINKELIEKNDLLNNAASELLKLKADLELQKAKKSAAVSGIEEVAEAFYGLTGISIQDYKAGGPIIESISIDSVNTYPATDDNRWGHIAYVPDTDFTVSAFKSNYGGGEIGLYFNSKDDEKGFTSTRTIQVIMYPIINETIKRSFVLKAQLTKGAKVAMVTHKIDLTEIDNSDVYSYLKQYAIYRQEELSSDAEIAKLEGTEDKSAEDESTKGILTEKQEEYDGLVKQIDKLKKEKRTLNQNFYKKYSRFIQEGTWLSEEYYDDDKYYTDALSTMYNSCYPQVSYNINTIEVSSLEGYELFNFELGEKTYVEDGEFFGYDENGIPRKEEIIICEKSEFLDDPSKDTNKVQTFKNQFQDLFQKITATTQQVQYSTGAYEKGVAEANAIAEDSVSFLNKTLSEMAVNLSNPDLESESLDKSSQLRIVDGKLLIGTKNQQTDAITWKTGISSNGISADLLTAGRIKTGEIQIYSDDSPTFRWDAKGISAYDYTSFNGLISGVNTKNFVRFDRHGLYGIQGQDGLTWSPSSLENIDENSTFALTWEGLKVTGNDKATARIGRQDNYIMVVENSKGKPTFRITNSGSIEMAGSLTVGGDLEGGESVEDYVNYAGSEALKNAKDYADAQINEAKSFIEGIRSNLQDQINGEITTWFYEGKPEITNAPAIEWVNLDNANNNNNEKIRHLGDLYYDTVTQYAYRWTSDSERTTFEWAQIADEEITKALAAANNAQTTADGKMKVFSQQPTPPYQRGDLWAQGGTGDLMCCKTSKESGAYSANDWEKASKYTDDTKAIDAYNEAIKRLLPSSTFDNGIVYDFNKNYGFLMFSGSSKPEENNNNYLFENNQNILFKVGKDSKGNPKVQMRGGGEFTGKIIANEGEIGGWNIDSDAIYSNASGLSTGMCSVYDDEYYTDGLQFTLNDDGNSYSVSGYTGTDVAIYIPKVYGDENKKAVTAIADQAFYSKQNIVSVRCPNSIISIGDDAFGACYKLTHFNIPLLVASIGEGAFSSCFNLEHITLSSTLTLIPKSCFRNCRSLTSIVIPSSVTEIGDEAFRGCTTITNVYIPSSVTSVYSMSFYDCNNATFYTEHKTIPSGWKISNTYMSQHLQLGCNFDGSYRHRSLVNNGFSYPRFYAGASCDNVPKTTDEVKFLVLEDGSLYASAAEISGTIHATDGDFAGTITSDSGRIGGLSFDGNIISSGENGLIFENTGRIVGNRLEVDTMHARKMAGRFDDSPYFEFESSNNDTEQIEIEIATFINEECEEGHTTPTKPGESMDIYIKNPGEVLVWAREKNGKKLTRSMSFKIEVEYNVIGVPGYNYLRIIEEHFVSIRQGESIGPTQSIVHGKMKSEFSEAVSKFAGAYFTGTTDTVRTYTQDKLTQTNVIKASAHLLPLTAGEGSGTAATGINLGADNCKWNYIYALNNGIGSDRKIKDNIENIDNEFSKRLIGGLMAKSYTYNTTSTPRVHYGFIAQDVEELLHSLGTSADEVGIVCKSKPGEPDSEDNHYSLNYINLMAPMVSVIQQLSKQVEELEEKLTNLQKSAII